MQALKQLNRKSTFTGRKELLEERKVLVEQFSDHLDYLRGLNLNRIDLLRQIREVEATVEESEEYQTEERVTYKKKMMRDAVKPLRDETKEIETAAYEARETLFLGRQLLDINMEERELLK